MSKQDEVCWPCEHWPELLTLQTRAAHTCGAEMGTAAECGGQTAVRGAGKPHGPSGDASPDEREAAWQAYRDGLHSNHCDCVAALTARLAEAEADAEEDCTVTRQADKAARDYAEQVRDLTARLAAVEAMVGEPCDCHGPGQPPLLTQLHAVEAERDTALADVARLRARTHELQHTYSQTLAPLQKRLDWFEGLWTRSLRWIETHQPDFEREAIAAWIARAPADVKDRIVRHPCSPAERARIGTMLALVEQVEAERDRLRRELAEMDDVAGHVAAERDRAEAALARQTAALEAIKAATVIMSVGPAARAWEIADHALRQEPTDGR